MKNSMSVVLKLLPRLTLLLLVLGYLVSTRVAKVGSEKLSSGEATKAISEVEKLEAFESAAHSATVDSAQPLEDHGFTRWDSQQLKDALSIVADNTLTIHRREMPLYWQLVQQSIPMTWEMLRRHSKHDPDAATFFLTPSKYRGELFSMEVNVRRVSEYNVEESNIEGITKIYEVWGWTKQAKSRPYAFITCELPQGLSPGKSVNVKSSFAGCFFKLQAYHSHVARPGDKPLSAPLFVGKFYNPSGNLKVKSSNSQNKVWMFAVLLVAPMIILRVFWKPLSVRRKKYSKAAKHATMGPLESGVQKGERVE